MPKSGQNSLLRLVSTTSWPDSRSVASLTPRGMIGPLVLRAIVVADIYSDPGVHLGKSRALD